MIFSALFHFVALAEKPNVFCLVTAGVAEQVEKDVQVGRSHRFQELFHICVLKVPLSSQHLSPLLSTLTAGGFCSSRVVHK